MLVGVQRRVHLTMLNSPFIALEKCPIDPNAKKQNNYFFTTDNKTWKNNWFSISVPIIVSLVY